MDLGQAVTLAGASILVGILVEVVKRTFAWADATTARFGPLVSIGIGIVVVEVLLLAQGQLSDAATIAAGAVTGLLAGASAAGLYDNVKSLAGK